MTEVAVIIPFASQEPHRLAALQRVVSEYAETLPGVPVIVTHDDGDRRGWSKAQAVRRGLSQTDAEILVIADGDCICEGVTDAADAVLSGSHAWASPHATIRRLDLASTAEVLSGATPHLGMRLVFREYRGVPGGGITVIRRDAYERVPLDPRFRVTHGEDTSWQLALKRLVGRPWRGKAALYHLWHPPTPPMGAKFDANTKLAERYKDALGRDSDMQAIIDEIALVEAEPAVRPIPSDATVGVIVPVMLRPEAADKFMATLRSSLSRPGDAHVYAVADEADVATRRAWEDAGATVILSDRGSRFGQKANVGYERTSEPWLLFVGDDVAFHPGWLEAGLSAAGEEFALVSTNDMSRTDLDHLAPHPLVRRDYVRDVGMSYDGPGTVAYEGYTHWYVDAEWSTLALARGVMTYAPDCRVEHRHPMFGKGESDAVYELGQEHAAKDRKRFLARKSRFDKRVGPGRA